MIRGSRYYDNQAFHRLLVTKGSPSLTGEKAKSDNTCSPNDADMNSNHIDSTKTITRQGLHRVTFHFSHRFSILAWKFISQRRQNEYKTAPTIHQMVKILIFPLYSKLKAVKSQLSITSFPESWNVSVPPSTPGYPMLRVTPSLRLPLAFAICTFTNNSCRQTVISIARLVRSIEISICRSRRFQRVTRCQHTI